MQQRSEEWFAARVGRVTGSRVGAILGLSPFMTRADVLRAMVREYHGAPSEFTGNVATEYGAFHEKFAIMDYEMRTGQSVEACGFFSFEDWLGASPDGLVGEEGLIEVKCPYGLRDKESPEFKSIYEQRHYYYQVQIEMHCAKRKWCDFYQWAPAQDCPPERVEYNEDEVYRVLPVLKLFHAEYLEAIKDPERHLCDRLSSANAKALANSYRELSEEIKSKQEALDAIKAELVDLADGQKRVIGDVLVYPTQRKGSISYSAAVKDLLPDADLEKYRGKPSTVWTVKC